MSRTTGSVLLVAVFGACASGAWGAAAPPSTVLVFNAANNSFDNNAQGYVWQQLGLLGPNGAPGQVTWSGNTGTIRVGGTVVGTATRDSQGRIVTLRNADGSKTAHNVSSSATSTNAAWNSVAKGGTMHVVKHGCTYKDKKDKDHFGGGIRLDGNNAFGGFTNASAPGPGTGAPWPGGPYPLTPRPGDNITINANACYSANDPDGTGPYGSVTGSTTQVEGAKQPAEGHTGTVYTNAQITFEGTPPNVQAATDKLKAAAKAAGFYSETTGQATMGHVSQWISSIPFAQQHSTVATLLQGTGVVNVGLTYSKAEPAGSGGSGMTPLGDPVMCRYMPTVMVAPLDPNETAFITYADTPDDIMTAGVLIEAGDLAGPSWFTINQLAQIPPLPPSAALASGMFDFTHPLEPDLPGVPPPALASTLDYALSIFGDPAAISPYSYSPTGGWQPLSTYSFVGGDLVITTSQVGIFAGLRDTTYIPEPATMLLLGSGLLALLRRRRRT